MYTSFIISSAYARLSMNVSRFAPFPLHIYYHHFLPTRRVIERCGTPMRTRSLRVCLRVINHSNFFIIFFSHPPPHTSESTATLFVRSAFATGREDRGEARRIIVLLSFSYYYYVFFLFLNQYSAPSCINVKTRPTGVCLQRYHIDRKQ